MSLPGYGYASIYIQSTSSGIHEKKGRIGEARSDIKIILKKKKSKENEKKAKTILTKITDKTVSNPDI